MDYLPVQATSVPCERVFSSAKETDTAKRNRIKSTVMEALQLFKFSIKKERLDFMAGWATPESAMTEGSRPEKDPLTSLLAAVEEDSEAALDNILKEF